MKLLKKRPGQAFLIKNRFQKLKKLYSKIWKILIAIILIIIIIITIIQLQKINLKNSHLNRAINVN